jgi:hypothetical protein
MRCNEYENNTTLTRGCCHLQPCPLMQMNEVPDSAARNIWISRPSTDPDEKPLVFHFFHILLCCPVH